MEHVIPAWMLIPFAVMLLSIAILPLIPKTAEWWESNWHKLLVSLLLGVPTAAWLGLHNMSDEIVHQMVYDYVPFILLLMALFVTTGGICIRGDLHATPLTNTIILAIGWVLASFMGTTGAAMLLLLTQLPLLRRLLLPIRLQLTLVTSLPNWQRRIPRLMTRPSRLPRSRTPCSLSSSPLRVTPSLS